VPVESMDPDKVKIHRENYFPLLTGNNAIGENSYVYSGNSAYNLPPMKGSREAGGDRVGFLRTTVIVEASTWTYTMTPPEDAWRATGITSKGWAEVSTVLRAMDAFLVRASDG
jgi:hypothetical protein